MDRSGPPGEILQIQADSLALEFDPELEGLSESLDGRQASNHQIVLTGNCHLHWNNWHEAPIAAVEFRGAVGKR
jgi:hypothetical protein